MINLAGPETLSVRDIALEFGQLFDNTVTLRGKPAEDALLSCSARAVELFGTPRISATQLLPVIAAWIRQGGPRLGGPTKFQSRDGRF